MDLSLARSGHCSVVTKFYHLHAFLSLVNLKIKAIKKHLGAKDNSFHLRASVLCEHRAHRQPRLWHARAAFEWANTRGVTTIDIEGDKSPPIIRNGQMSPPIFEILALICCPPLRSALVRMTKKALKVTFSVCSSSAANSACQCQNNWTGQSNQSRRGLAFTDAERAAKDWKHWKRAR